MLIINTAQQQRRRLHQSEKKNGEIHQGEQGDDTPPGPLHRPQGHRSQELRRRHPRPPLGPLPRRRRRQVPGEGHPQGLRQEAGKEIAHQGLHQVGKERRDLEMTEMERRI
ncbi:palmitoyltransferase ZDHHC5 [Striga asiatica]|uniref:Palmitoyltransferase ZDHHC5 n=1 Tax=Striga asiatica TaxID=4170 RepID=A0A5A7R8R6_STRAF|nr:palmitoyltransferase ZDHHC5 [Striga asiatica]